MGDKVKCCNCNWNGIEDGLVPFMDEDGGGFGCPNCKTDSYLIDVPESEVKMKWYLCHECGNVWDAENNTCPACGNHKNVWDITDMPEYKYLIERTEKVRSECGK